MVDKLTIIDERSAKSCLQGAYLSHGTRRARPHLLRLLELGAEIGRGLGGFGVRRSHLRDRRPTEKETRFKQFRSVPTQKLSRETENPRPKIGKLVSCATRFESLVCVNVFVFRDEAWHSVLLVVHWERRFARRDGG